MGRSAIFFWLLLKFQDLQVSPLKGATRVWEAKGCIGKPAGQAATHLGPFRYFVFFLFFLALSLCEQSSRNHDFRRLGTEVQMKPGLSEALKGRPGWHPQSTLFIQYYLNISYNLRETLRAQDATPG